MNGEAILELSGVVKSFGSGPQGVTAVKGVSLEARLGTLVLVLGPSGSGKTTLLTLGAGLLEPTSGTVRLFGRDLTAMPARELQALRAARIGFVFQNFLLIDSLTAEENVALALRFAGQGRARAARKAQDVLRRLKIAHLAGKFPPQLSQGEKQRVAVARAIANDADLIIADEPTASLEIRQGLEIIELLHEYAKARRGCVLVASHDPRLTEVADRVLRMDGGTLAPSPQHPGGLGGIC